MKDNLSILTVNLSVMLVTSMFLISCDHSSRELKSKDLHERSGVQNTFFKLKNQDTVKVAYLGGSITAQSGWRVYSLKWFRENYPETTVVEINAAIGGTGSDFGVYRLQDHVLQYDSDLVFVEFAVNDASTNPETISQSMEGIIHQIWQQDPMIDICFIYTIKSDFIETYEKDSLPSSIATMEEIADYYQIPSINFGYKVLRRVNQGKLLFKGDEAAKDTIRVFSPDGVHPYPDSGHKIYEEVFIEAFNQMKTNSGNKIVPHKVPQPLTPDISTNTKMFSWTEIKNNRVLTPVIVGDDPEFKKFRNYFESVGVGEPGDSITIQFSGRSIGFYDLMGPGGGTVQLTLDGQPKKTFSRFDKYCTYWRISYKTVTGLRDTVHTAVFKVLDKSIDKKEILSERDNTMENEGEYVNRNWYLAKVLVDGDLIDNQE
ncbi:SGNH/GDSL hydrolase family protein [Reichenbachiella sp. MALMAid0571]|uniref:SGNH/GDSL hydrolase family protein n=1 Tax=Reichenbachiella sp. MALMAid0571 TaxID=3143939 RepID=UPI0032E04C60